MSRRRVGCAAPGAVTWKPRSTSSRLTPCSARASRCPEAPRGALRPCTWTSRTRTGVAPGWSISLSPSETAPPQQVPVTTTPAPGMVKMRSIGSRNAPSSARTGRARASAFRAAFSSSSPMPLWAETATMGLPSRKVPSTSSAASSVTTATKSSSTMSIFATTTTPLCTPSELRISRCSMVWGMTPSSPAITRNARSTPPAPETICLTNCSCPGMSTTPSCTPSPRSSSAKPSSMLMPRSRSSFRRSVLVPVKRGDQGGLAVIHVPGGAEDEMSGGLGHGLCLPVPVDCWRTPKMHQQGAGGKGVGFGWGGIEVWWRGSVI